jgi:hypothetical protein
VEWVIVGGKAGKEALMRKLLISLVAMAAVAGQSVAQEPQHEATLEVMNNKQVVSFDAPKQLTLKFWLQQLMLSALYRNVVQESSLDEERQSLSFDEVILTLPADRYPSYVFIKRGQQIHRLAKYDPWVLRKLLSEAELPVYEGLSGIERALF